MRAIAVSAVAVMLAMSAVAQKQTAPRPLSERIDVSIVNVDVTVLEEGDVPRLRHGSR